MNTIINQLLAVIHTVQNSNLLTTAAIALPAIGAALYAKKKKKKKFRIWLLMQKLKLYQKLGFKKTDENLSIALILGLLLLLGFLVFKLIMKLGG